MGITSFIAYLELEKKYSSHTLKAYRTDLHEFAGFLKEGYGEEQLEQVSYSLVRNWMVSLLEKGISHRSVNRKMASLKAYYKYLLRTGQLTQSPMIKHKALKIARKVEVPFSEEEMHTLLQELPFEDDFEGVRDKLLIALLYTTGIRRAELISLRLGNLDLNSKTIKVLGKRNKERIVPLLESNITLFQAYFQHRDGLVKILDERHVFLTKAGNKLYETLVYRIINGYFSKVSSKLKKSPHILRHTFATHLLNKGADMNSVKELLGHSSLASTQVYTHNSIAELKKVHASAHPRSKE